METMKANHAFFRSLLILLPLAFASCSTLHPARSPGRVEGLLRELGTADQARLVELSALPFLLDGEYVSREEDLLTLWKNLATAGFSFKDPQVVALDPVDAESFRRFGDDEEAEAFFKKYLSKDARLAEVRTAYGTFLVIAGSRVGFTPRIYGFTGPEGN
jgi:hypothetical protein